MNRRLRWVLGLLTLIALFSVLISRPPASLLEWQSTSLMRFFYVLLICCVLCLYRILRGPTPADRIVAIDILGILVIGFCAVLGIPTGRPWYIDIGIAWALQSFIGTIALAKYLEGKGFEE